MKPPGRSFLQLAAGASALPAVSRFAWAQTYPTRPVRLIVGFAAGGPADIAARLIGQSPEAVVRAAPDGYALLQASATNAFNATLYDKLNFDFVRDIAPVTSLTVQRR